MAIKGRIDARGKLVLDGLDRLPQQFADQVLEYARQHEAALLAELTAQADGYPAREINCADCFHFQPDQIGDTQHALGSCSGDPWDGFEGQWPRKCHKCANFIARA